MLTHSSMVHVTRNPLYLPDVPLVRYIAASLLIRKAVPGSYCRHLPYRLYVVGLEVSHFET